MTTGELRGYRSIFWPILLIEVGVIWLLSNLDLIPGWSWWSLGQLWPLILVAIGLDLIFARRSPILGALLGLATIGLAMVLLVAAPSLGFTPSTDVVTENFSAPLASATSAEVDLELSVGQTTVTALQDSPNLIEAEVRHVGEVRLTVEGETQKHVRLEQVSKSFGMHLNWPGSDALRWDVGLSDAIPLDLTVDGSVGTADLDLSHLQLAGLDVNVGVGDVVLVLPAMASNYEVSIDGGVGDGEIRISEGAAMRMDVQGGVGDIVIDVPDDASVRLEAQTDVGDVHVPAGYLRVGSGGEQFIGEDGVWETDGFAQAERQITIYFDGGVGDLTLR